MLERTVLKTQEKLKFCSVFKWMKLVRIYFFMFQSDQDWSDQITNPADWDCSYASFICLQGEETCGDGGVFQDGLHRHVWRESALLGASRRHPLQLVSGGSPRQNVPHQTQTLRGPRLQPHPVLRHGRRIRCRSIKIYWKHYTRLRNTKWNCR